MLADFWAGFHRLCRLSSVYPATLRGSDGSENRRRGHELSESRNGPICCSASRFNHRLCRLSSRRGKMLKAPSFTHLVPDIKTVWRCVSSKCGLVSRVARWTTKTRSGRDAPLKTYPTLWDKAMHRSLQAQARIHCKRETVKDPSSPLACSETHTESPARREKPGFAGSAALSKRAIFLSPCLGVGVRPRQRVNSCRLYRYHPNGLKVLQRRLDHIRNFEAKCMLLTLSESE